ncbi:MAG TPA: YdeI/OmpD-associated family protein [Candidatus Limnocylindrales bacterium]|nr:YdeI/OmpD-associated family protein [Candidatus Limnocylindrales bacterium]
MEVQVGALDEAPKVQLDDRWAWRAWLEAHHATARGVWLVTWRPRSGRAGLTYEAAIQEALCFGWVDSTGGVLDEERGQLYFAPRKPWSVWAASNKARVERLIAEGRMAPAGLAAIERAKANGSWTVLDSVERLEIPDDLAAALAGLPGGAAAFASLSPSARKQHLAAIALARRPETRADRVRRVVASLSRTAL